MSNTKTIIFTSKLKSLFFTRPTFYSVWFINWPEKISYEAWQELLKSYLWFIGKNTHSCVCRFKRKRKPSRRFRKLMRAKEKMREKVIEEQTIEIINQLEKVKPTDNDVEPGANKDIQLELITILKRFYEARHMSEHIENTIPDHRNQELITYSKQSIMMAALAIFLFRMGSGNKFDDKTHDDDEKYSRANMARLIDAPEDRVPVIKTIETFLANLKEKSVNELMIAFFKDLQKSKFFKQHPQLMPGDFFLLAADCVHTHTYDHPHHLDVDGNNDCDCCLKRVYNKNTPNEKIKWLHNTLVFCFIFSGGLKIPIYRYPIHATQIFNVEDESDAVHKQECELVALKAALPSIRQAFPKMKIVLLLDGLYANKPVIQLAQDYKCGYIIVRKEACLTVLAKECDEKAKHSNHKKNCTKKCRQNHKEWVIEQKYEWFNNMYLGDGISTNIFRFLETRTKNEEVHSYKCEWLISWRLSENNCESTARQARSRWDIEDFFNTCKNRGYNLKHDYSRNPHSCFNWHGLALFAFGFFDLFRFSEAVKKRGNWPQSTLAEKLLGQILYRPTEEIFSKGNLLKKIQFRYHFVVNQILTTEIRLEDADNGLNTGQAA